jgi:autotransporter passenger strand-loop-strand repeat protein
VEAGGSSNGVIVNNGGDILVLSGGLAVGATVSSGGLAVVSSGGSASGTVVRNGGQDFDFGFESGTIVSSGGRLFVEAGASDSASQVNSGGTEQVFSGGVASGAVISGGTLEIKSGGSTGAAAVKFAVSGGGILQLDNSQAFGGLVAGFGQPDLLDLRDIAFISGTTQAIWTQSGTSGTLVVSDSSHSASITLLGQYSTANFHVSSDSFGATFVSDPPVTVATAATLTNPQHGT